MSSIDNLRPMRLGFVGVLVIVIVWHFCAASGAISPAFLPTPWAAASALRFGLTHGDLLEQLGDTVSLMFRGWFVASLLGIGLGTLIGISPTIGAYVEPTVEFLRPLPPSAVAPLAISLLGLGPGMVLAVVIFGSVWPPLLSTAQAFALIDPRLREVARCLGLSRPAFVLKIGLPSMTHDLVGALRVSISLALILTVLGEMLAAQNGLGYAALLAARSFNAPRLYAAIILLAFLGATANLIILLAERRLMSWNIQRA
ncbi:ABC transporter permease [Bradyrhizobium sp.]|uniref:ABC transporter permease n=1 Tax=Bradyrhizobium sp. TaxID=376 RepID=UPI003C350D9B